MRKLFLAVALASVSLTGGCATLGSPSAVASVTTVDEKLYLSALTGYTAASTMGRTLAKTHFIDVAEFKRLDAQAYAGVQVMKAAYAAGNRSSFYAAEADVKRLVASITALTEGS